MTYQISVFSLHKLSEYAEIFPGYAFKSEGFTEDPADLPLVKGENVHQGFIDWIGAKRWPKSESAHLSRYLLKPGDIVLAMDRPWVTAGLKWSYIKEHDPVSLLVQRVARLRARKGLNQTYLRCVISSLYFSKYIEPIVTGVNVPHISGKQIGDFRIPIPSLPIQEKISSLIAAYDDLIENNKRRIAILEKMAEEIYREWFVRMRFNGYQKTKFSKGIPAGWKAGRLSDLLDDACIQTGKRPKGGAQESGIPSIGAENVVGLAKYNFDKEKYVGEDFFNAMRHGHIEDRDVLFYKDGAEIGRVTLFQDHFPHAKCCVNEHVFILRTEEKLWQYFLYFYLNQEAVKAYVKLINKNAAQPGINKKELKSLPLVLPKPEVIDSFNQVIAPIVQAIFALAKTEVNLKKTRDLLLPRLISGKLSVEHIELPSNENASPISNALPQAELAHA